MTCPSSIVLSRAFSRGAPGELQGHLLTCPSCAEKWRELTQARAAARELPYVTPDPERRAQVRQRLLAAAASQPLPAGVATRARWLALAGAAALLAVVMGASRLRERAPVVAHASHFRAVVLSQGASRFVHERSGSDEWVRLSDGTLMVEVQPLQPGERFRVLCGDSEVEVRGTAFTTRVERDHLLSVDVLHGRVEVRPPDGQVLLLGAGGHWQPADGPSRAESPAASALSRSGAASPSTAPAPARPAVPSGRPASAPAAPRAPTPVAATAAAARQPAAPGPAASASLATAAPPAPATARAVASSAAAAERSGAPAASDHAAPGPLPAAGPASAEPRATISPAERAFLDGWTALRQGHHQVAAACFTRAAEPGGGAPSASLLEDARFWRAVALARAGQRPLAVAALRDFLQQHPGSGRAGEATAILGWQLLRAGQLDQAQRCFATAEKDSHAAIRDNARAGLAAVAAHRQGRASPAGSDPER